MTSEGPTREFRGVIPPVLTPMNEDKSIDEKALAAVVDWFCDRPVGGLFLTGALGEWRFLEWKERERIMRVAVEVAGGRLPIVPHIGGRNDIDNIVKLGKVAEELGVHAVALVIPDDIPEGPEAIYEHVTAVARQVNLPLAFYDTAGEGPRSVPPSLLTRLLDEGIRIAAMKYRAMRGDNMLEMCQAAEGRTNVLAGAETVLLPALSVGAEGVIGGGCNIWPALMVRLMEHYEAGRNREALEDQREVNRLLDVSSQINWPLAGKVIWQSWGLPVQPYTRAPVDRSSPEKVREVQRIFEPLQELAG